MRRGDEWEVRVYGMEGCVTDTRRFYKWLGENGEPHHGGRGQWPLPTKRDDGTWEPGLPLRVEGELIPCENGLHLCRERDLVEWIGPTLWVAQYRGELIEADNKIVVREAWLLQRLEAWNDRTARLFAADCAERALREARVEDRRPWHAVEVARRYANGQATVGELTAAGVAARVAAWDAARYAAWDAAWDAAGDAAWDAAWDAAREWQTARLMAYLRSEV